jgi:arylsulfatase A-like enzyme
MNARWLCLLLCAATLAAQPDSRPNVLIIVADDLGWGDVGAFGNREIPTPHIDRLAREGMRLTSAYATAAVCSPSRAGFFTGRHQARFGHDFNPAGVELPLAALPLTEKTVADRMRAAGYRTGLVGKWHLGGGAGEFNPVSRGFDEFFGYVSAAAFITKPEPGDETVDLPGEPPLRANRFFRNREPAQAEGYLTEIETQEALAFLDRNHQKPFFLTVTYHAPHVPLQATRKYIERVKHIQDPVRRVYAAMISALDDGVGDLMKKLDDLKIARNTLVVFTSDNGCPRYLPAGACSNGPVQGFKRDHLEGGIRIPAIVRYAALKAGSEYREPVLTLDFAATALRLAGADLQQLDGRDLMPYLTAKDKGSPHQRLFWRAGANYAVHSGDWKLWVVDAAAGGQETFLFNLKTDPKETTNLAPERPDVAAGLKDSFQTWNRGNPPPRYAGRSAEIEVGGKRVKVSF